MKKLLVTMAFCGLLAAGNVHAANVFFDFQLSGDNDWTNDVNWNTGTQPTAADGSRHGLLQ